jgi:O-antigen ligase
LLSPRSGAPAQALSVACVLAASLAAAAPTLLAYNVSPSPTFYNQALALALWGVWVLVSAPTAPGRGLLPVWLALGLMAAATVASWGPGGLPASLALSSLGLLAAAGLLLAAGAGARRRPEADSLFAAFCWAYAIAGLLNALVAAVQVFAPLWTDGTWLATSGMVGRAVGNLRQPNHLSSVLTWGCIAVAGLVEMRRLRLRLAAPALALLVAAIVLTASRTGLVSVLLLALWALLDRRLRGATRVLLLAAPLVYGLAWWGAAQWAAATLQAFGGTARLAETDISGSRFGIWANTLALIRQQPWTGVGWGEFNFAWTLTPFPGRPTAFFDHTHNLPLQLLVELGLPLGGAVLGLLLWALWRAAARAWARVPAPAPVHVADAAGPAGLPAAQRCALMMVLMIGLHSLLEYPLWYAYFLLPTAWAWGFALGAPRGPGVGLAGPSAGLAGLARPSAVLAGLAAALVLGAGYAVADYRSVVAIFRASAGDAPLAQRIAAGQRSLFFAHHADYAAATAGVAVAGAPLAFDRATHYLLDTRLMMAWAQALASQGREAEARHLAQRLREFRKADAAAFFAPCDRPASAPSPSPSPGQVLPFQCQAAGDVAWRRYLPAAD